MSGDQRTAMQWVIRVDGSNTAVVEPGETVEIGRKPIRPLPQGLYRRVEITDDTRSMSKKHAQLTVKSDGSAIIRDLNSTNGTYFVHTGSQLDALPAGRDFRIHGASARLMLGDVAVELIAQPMRMQSQQFHVPNLFDYATDDHAAQPSQEADPQISVDNILNLRAGEPTNLFNAESVKRRAQQLRQAQQRSFTPFDPLAAPLTSESWTSEEEADPEEHPRDLFADAQDIAAGKMEEPAPKIEEFVPRVTSGPRHKGAETPVVRTPRAAMPAPKDPVQAAAQAMRFQPQSMVTSKARHAVEEPVQAQEPEPVAEPAQAAEVPEADATVAVEQSTPAPVIEMVEEAVIVEPVVAASQVEADTEPAQPEESAQPQEDAVPRSEPEPEAQAAEHVPAEQDETASEEVFGTVAEPEEPAVADESQVLEEQEVSEEAAPSEEIPAQNETATLFESDVDALDEESAEPESGEYYIPIESHESLEATQAMNLSFADEQEDYSRFQRPAQEPQPVEEPHYEPAFEPGSIFERVSQGEFDQPQELVEVDGYTSNDARQSDDFAEQFEMARHPQLLPFLAMNPSLYDDLYAWLAAQGDADIDEALTNNPGYEDYKKAVGK